MLWSAMNCRWADAFQDGVSRPAAESSRARNQEGMGCVWVSMRVAALKSGRVVLAAFWASKVMELRASWEKGRMVRSMLSRAALAFMRSRSVWEVVVAGGVMLNRRVRNNGR